MIRLAEPADEAFIVSGWSSSYRMSRDSTIPMPLWAETYRPIVRWYLAKPRVVTLVHSGELLHGFICFEPKYVHYVYVAAPYRKQGFARELMLAAGIEPNVPFRYSHRTGASAAVRSKIPNGRYDSMSGRFADEERAHG